MKKIKSFLLWLLAPLLWMPVQAQNLNSVPKVQTLTNAREWLFVENKGQLVSEKGQPLSDIKYYGKQGGATVYLSPGRLSFLFSTKDKSTEAISEATGRAISTPGQPHEATKRMVVRADMQLLNANSSADILASEQQSYFENFYLSNTTEQGITNVHTYKTITYHDVYPHIDMVLHVQHQGLKYEFVVRPGGDPADIQIKWNGLRNMQLAQNGGITYALATGSFSESAPYSYQGNSAHKVGSRFALDKKYNSIGFKTEAYDHKQTLVIDPSLLWATYYGEWDYTDAPALATDASGNVLIGGNTSDQSVIATSDTYQPKFLTSGAPSEAYVAKFNSSGSRLWGTYYSNGVSDQVTSLAADASGNVFAGISADSASSNSLTTSSAYQTVYRGSLDALLLKLNSSGQRVWATLYGGERADMPNCVKVDASGNVYMTGTTSSTSYIASSSAFQTTLKGKTDAFIVKFSNSGSRIWATYYGGKDNDGSSMMALDASGNIYITGNTGSTTDIATSGAYQTDLNSSNNAFTAKFDSSGSRIWATYNGGNAIALDGSGNIYVTGTTPQNISNLITSGAYQTTRGGFSDGFIIKFNSSGSALLWGTYYGGTETDYLTGIAADSSGNIYVVGATASPTGLASTDGYMKALNGGSNIFLAVFNSSGSRKYGTYYGGDHDNNNLPVAVAIDGASNVYFTGLVWSTGLATVGAHDTYHQGGEESSILVKFSFGRKHGNDAAAAGVLPDKGWICPGSQSVSVKVKNMGSNTIDSVHIGWTFNKSLKPSYKYIGTIAPDSTVIVNIGSAVFTPGYDLVKVWTYRPNGQMDSVSFNDSMIIIDTVLTMPVVTLTGDTGICAGSSANLHFNLTGLAADEDWTITFRKSGSTVDSSISGHGITDVVYRSSIMTSSTTYTITGITVTYHGTVCYSPLSYAETINVHPLPNSSWTSSISGSQYLFIPQDTSLASSAYIWNFGDSSAADTGHKLLHLFPHNSTYTVKLKVRNPFTGCASETDSTINTTVSGIEKALATGFNLDIYPNPSEGQTRISFDLSREAHVQIMICDISGKQLQLFTDEQMTHGHHQLTLDAARMNLSAGTYLVNMMVNNQHVVKKIVLQ